jgi:hypothetical protein
VSVLDDLVEVRRILSNPLNWTKDDLYAPSDEADNGYCYCLAGALSLVTGRIHLDPQSSTGHWTEVQLGPSFKRYHEARDVLCAALQSDPRYPRLMSAFNDADTTTHEDILDLVDRAIAALPEESN